MNLCIRGIALNTCNNGLCQWFVGTTSTKAKIINIDNHPGRIGVS